MPEPIKVDFRRRRARPSRAPQAPRPPASRGGAKEPAVNWRAVPRFLIIVVPILIALAALQWLLAR